MTDQSDHFVQCIDQVRDTVYKHILDEDVIIPLMMDLVKVIGEYAIAEVKCTNKRMLEIVESVTGESTNEH